MLKEADADLYHPCLARLADGATWFDYPSVSWVGDDLHIAYRAIPQRGGPWKTVDVRYLKLPKTALLRGGVKAPHE